MHQVAQQIRSSFQRVGFGLCRDVSVLVEYLGDDAALKQIALCLLMLLQSKRLGYQLLFTIRTSTTKEAPPMEWNVKRITADTFKIEGEIEIRFTPNEMVSNLRESPRGELTDTLTPPENPATPPEAFCKRIH